MGPRWHRRFSACRHRGPATLQSGHSSTDGNRLRYTAAICPFISEFRGLRRFQFYSPAQFVEVAARTTRSSTWRQNSDAPARVLHRVEPAANRGDGDVIVSVSKPFGREMDGPPA